VAIPAAKQKTFPLAPVIVAGVFVLALLGGVVYLNRPVAKSPESGASSEAKAYLHNLELTDVTMKATENFMKQRVVEVEGNIANKGPRTLESIDVYCLFYGVDGREVYRERVPIVAAKGPDLKPGAARAFRLPFDTLPDSWNQVVPKMVIARMTFAH